MPEADAGRDAKRQMGKNTHTDERECARNKATKGKYPHHPTKKQKYTQKRPIGKKKGGNKKKKTKPQRACCEKNRQGEEIGPGNEDNTKQQTQQQPTKHQTTYEIILTQPTTEKETMLTQIPVKTKQDKEHLQVPKPKQKQEQETKRKQRSGTNNKEKTYRNGTGERVRI